MAHFVAKELGLRPYQILTEWTVEELMVSFGEYANAKSHESWEMMTPKQRAQKHKKHTDQWAVMFVSLEDALAADTPEGEQQRQEEISLENAASILFG